MEKKQNKAQEKKSRKKRDTNSFKTLEVVFLIVITCIISLIMGWSFSNNGSMKSKFIITDDKELNEFIENYQYLLKNYYDNVDKKTLLEGATEGMIKQLNDQYSSMIPQEESNNFNIRLSGTYEGLGIEIINDQSKNIIVYNIIENSPAQEAGLKVGDVIVKINDKNFKGKETTELSNYVLNNKQSEFKVTVERENQEKNFKLIRKKITLKSVQSEIIEQDSKKIGYIYISIFSNDTYNQFKEELKTLEDSKIDSLIIDVRDNTGGHLTTVSKIASLFLDQSHVIYQTQTKKQTKKYYSKGKTTKKYKIIVLQNENSASASELLSATLKEEYGAIVVGTKSYGKGTVQELITTSSGTEYKFTTKKWLTPKGNWIHEKGVEPNIVVELNSEYEKNPTKENDNQYQKAIEEAKK